MRNLLLGGLLAALAVAGLGLWLRGREAPGALPAAVPMRPPAPVDAPPPPPPEGAAAPEAAAPAVAAEQGPGLEVAPGAKRMAPAREPVSAAPPPPEDPYPSLDQLLQLPPPAPAGPQSVEWTRERGVAEGRDPARRRLRVDYSRENLTEGVPMQPERRRTDVGVSVRVDEADRVRVRGGVRVEEHQETDEEREAERTPTVGVEMRF